eukprot:gene9305-1573_t
MSRPGTVQTHHIRHPPPPLRCVVRISFATVPHLTVFLMTSSRRELTCVRHFLCKCMETSVTCYKLAFFPTSLLPPRPSTNPTSTKTKFPCLHRHNYLLFEKQDHNRIGHPSSKTRTLSTFNCYTARLLIRLLLGTFL